MTTESNARVSYKGAGVASLASIDLLGFIGDTHINFQNPRMSMFALLQDKQWVVLFGILVYLIYSQIVRHFQGVCTKPPQRART